MFKESDYLVALQAATRLFDGDERKAVDWLARPARAFADTVGDAGNRRRR